MDTNNREEYLGSLNMMELLDLLEDTVEHRHYCPCECHCFDGRPYKDFEVSEIKELIIKTWDN
jgi:hypothetical protein